MNKFKKSVFVRGSAYLLSVIFWLLVWQLAAAEIDNSIFLPKPGDVFDALFGRLIKSPDFWASVTFSVSHILEGFFLSLAAAVLLAGFSCRFTFIRVLLWFPVKLIKSIPVASFVILTLLWVDSSNLAPVISFLMVFPVIYINSLTGFESADKSLLEMAKVYRMTAIKKIRYIFLPAASGYIFSSCEAAVGMAWKSGIAAEIIGLVRSSIGNKLYQSKIYLMTDEMFAWTLVIVILCVLSEQLIKLISILIKKRFE